MTIIVAVVYAIDVPVDENRVATWERFVEELPECPGEKILFVTGELACEPRDVANPDFDVDVRSHGRELRPLTDE